MLEARVTSHSGEAAAGWAGQPQVPLTTAWRRWWQPSSRILTWSYSFLAQRRGRSFGAHSTVTRGPRHVLLAGSDSRKLTWVKKQVSFSPSVVAHNNIIHFHYSYQTYIGDMCVCWQSAECKYHLAELWIYYIMLAQTWYAWLYRLHDIFSG